MKKTYYYYSAVAIQNESISYIKGVTYTTEKDFPFLDVENDIAKSYNNITQNIVITFYKKITKTTYKTYIKDKP